MLIHDDRLFPADPATRAHGAPALCERQGSADRLAARPYRSALVCRGRAVSRSGDAVRRSRPLHFPHALQPGHRARTPRHPAALRRRGGLRPARGLAPFRRALPSLPRHADAHVARPCLRDAVRLQRAALGAPPPTTISTASARRSRPRNSVRARSSSASASRRSPRPTARSTARASRRGQGSGWNGRVVPTYRPDAVVDPEFEGFRANVEKLGEITGCDTLDLGRLSRGAPQAPRLLQGARRDLHRSRPSDRADRRSLRRRCGGAVRARRSRGDSRPRRRSCSAPRC